MRRLHHVWLRRTTRSPPNDLQLLNRSPQKVLVQAARSVLHLLSATSSSAQAH
ncbi:hypothetical protein DPMN_128374 [Dreissena polymorpha]|uniref:Uncharacterized protein n=1 Tax=Dreissena polymorpha TaxID=45954 RepID=A0A9D4H2Z8_DREPO|nr:hypothetical protein DPMN_128374 [Dreissena polymorpha]